MDLSKEHHRKIFSLFIDHHELTYTEISNGAALQSNLLQYYLKQLLVEGLLQKTGSTYQLSPQAEYFIPFFKQMVGQERLKLPVVLIAVTKRDKVLLIERKYRPYQGFWSLPGGKIQYDETILDAAKRITEKETGVQLGKVSCCAVLDERIKDNYIKHGWLIVLMKASPKYVPLQVSQHCDWFSIKKLNGKIIPSDQWMIKKLLKKKIPLTNVLICEEDGKIKKFEYTNGQ